MQDLNVLLSVIHNCCSGKSRQQPNRTMEPTVPSEMAKRWLYTLFATMFTLHQMSVHSTYKILENFKMWCWKRMENISWTNRARNEEPSQRVKENGILLYTRQRRKGKWIGHTLWRNCLLKHIIEGKIGGRIEAWRPERRHKQVWSMLMKREDTGSWKRKH